MEFNLSSPPNRSFLARLGISTAFLAVSLTAAKYLARQADVSEPLLWFLALLPGLAMVGIFYAYGMLIVEQKDEFLRMLVVRQLIIATGIALTFATVWGFLESFGLAPHVYPYYVAIVWIAGFGFGGLVNRVTHGAWGELS